MKKVSLKNKQYTEEVKLKIIELLEEDEKFSKIKKEHEQKRAELQTFIKNFMFVNGMNALQFKAFSGEEFAANPQMLECKIVTPCSIEFLPDKMIEALGKDEANNYIETEINISDWNGFMEYMKELGADANKVKSFLNVEKKVDKKMLDNAEKLGQISLQDLKGCYKVTKKNSYLKISRIKEE